jgi:hypothetical protein
MEGICELKHNRHYTTSLNRSSPRSDVCQRIVDNVSTKLWMAMIHVGVSLWGCCAFESDTLSGTHSVSVWTCPIMYIAIAVMFIRTFPVVLDRFGSLSDGEVSWSSFCCTPGDHSVFLEGDALRDGDGNDFESSTGACISFGPRRVCTVLTSCKSPFGFDFLIFGIDGWSLCRNGVCTR